jgi:galactokinase
MDSFVIAHASPGQAMHLDCEHLTWHYVDPLLPDCAWVVMDSRASRTLAGSAYNERRRVCESAAAKLGLAHLAQMSDATQWEALNDPEERRLARHVFTETQRVATMEDALVQQDAKAVGACLLASHHSLRDDYRVSSPALDALVERATQHAACRGARMTGAGFGGCAIALVAHSAMPSFLAHMEAMPLPPGMPQARCFPALTAETS